MTNIFFNGMSLSVTASLSAYIHSIDLSVLSGPTIAFRLCLAILCGGVLGFERMRKLRAAGLRTYLMVCIGSCIAMMTGEYVNLHFGTGDPMRIAAQVISGIGFIGAGTIMITGNNRIKGLTTAAGLWANAALGLASGAGMYTGALMGLAVAILCMTVGASFQNHVLERSSRIRVFALIDSEESFKNLMWFTKEEGMNIVEFESNTIIGSCTGFTLIIDLPPNMTHHQAMKRLHASGLTFFSEED